VRPRLTDAEFFFKQDKKQPLEDFNERLKNVVFQENSAASTTRPSAFPNWPRSSPAHRRQRRVGGRAGLLSKCDLATEMVGEFPEMQGVAGYYYALNDGEPEDVALALNEQYMPRGAGAELPRP
jgi:glycyl-tRNA synthetase beta chain